MKTDDVIVTPAFVHQQTEWWPHARLVNYAVDYKGDKGDTMVYESITFSRQFDEESTAGFFSAAFTREHAIKYEECMKARPMQVRQTVHH